MTLKPMNESNEVEITPIASRIQYSISPNTNNDTRFPATSAVKVIFGKIIKKFAQCLAAGVLLVANFWQTLLPDVEIFHNF